MVISARFIFFWHQLLHQPAQVPRRRAACDHLVLADPRFAQRFLLHRIARGSGALVVAGALVFERVAGAAVGVDQQQGLR